MEAQLSFLAFRVQMLVADVIDTAAAKTTGFPSCLLDISGLALD